MSSLVFLGIITSSITIGNSSSSFFELKPHLIDIFKKIFNVSAIRIAVELSQVTKKSISNIEFLVHVRSFNYEETEGIKNITEDANFTAIIKNYTEIYGDEKFKNITVENAYHVEKQLDLGMPTYSTSCRHPNSHLNYFLL